MNIVGSLLYRNFRLTDGILNVLFTNAQILILLFTLNLQLALSTIYFKMSLSSSVNLREISAN